MAKSIGRAKSTIRNEVIRRGGAEDYDAVTAQLDFESKQYSRLKHRRGMFDTCRVI